MKFQLLIESKILKNNNFPAVLFILLIMLKYANNCCCWHFNIYEQNKFHTQYDMKKG